jgi:hypothetical protein
LSTSAKRFISFTLVLPFFASFQWLGQINGEPEAFSPSETETPAVGGTEDEFTTFALQT